jgi:hypothetical protein
LIYLNGVIDLTHTMASEFSTSFTVPRIEAAVPRTPMRLDHFSRIDDFYLRNGNKQNTIGENHGRKD